MIHDNTKSWLRAIVEFGGTTQEARSFAQQLLDVLANPSSGVDLIAAERLRQLEAKGYGPNHDSTHNEGSLAVAGAVLATEHTEWPHEPLRSRLPAWVRKLQSTCQHKTDVRRLTIAGALIAAEIDRLQRLARTTAKDDLRRVEQGE